LYLVLAHLVADFMLQPYALVQLKRKPVGMAIHTGVHAALTAIVAIPLLPRWWFGLLVLVVSHYLIDRTKIEAGSADGPASLGAFLLDQAAHLGVLALVVVVGGGSLTGEIIIGSPSVTGFLYYAVAYITATFAGAILVYQIAVAFRTRPKPESLLAPRPRVVGMVVRAAALTVVLFLPLGLWWIGAVPFGVMLWADRHEAGRWTEAAASLGLAIVLGVMFR
jgi:hypothetical protein